MEAVIPNGYKELKSTSAKYSVHSQDLVLNESSNQWENYNKEKHGNRYYTMKIVRDMLSHKQRKVVALLKSSKSIKELTAKYHKVSEPPNNLIGTMHTTVNSLESQGFGKEVEHLTDYTRKIFR